MAAFAGLLDGGLSVKVGLDSNWSGGSDYTASVHGLELETTNHGIGEAHFWMEVGDPFSPQTTYNALKTGARVQVTHTYDPGGGNVTTGLYRGYIVSDPRAAYAGERAVVYVDCGGPMEVARWRQDLGFIYTERDPSQWWANKRNGNWVTVDTGDSVYIGVDEGTKVPYGPGLGFRSGVVGYVPYIGATYLLGTDKLYGVKRLRGKCRWNLEDGLDGRVCWASAYTKTRDRTSGDWGGVIKAFNTNGNSHGWVDFDTGVGENWEWNPPSAGAGYIAVMLWSTKTGGSVASSERFIEFDNLEMYLGSTANEKRIDEAMTNVASFIGLHNTTSTSAVYSVEQSLAVRPMTDSITALTSFAEQADELVEWGWWPTGSGIQWRCNHVPKAVGNKTNPTTGIRSLANCYLVSAATPGVTWDVSQHPEDGIAKAVRLVYGATAQSVYPAGFPRSVIATKHPNFNGGTPYAGANCPVLVVDWTDHNYSDNKARKVAKKLAKHLGLGASSGTVRLQTASGTVPVYTGGTKPIPYIQGGDWIECSETQTKNEPGPLYITRAHVYVDSGAVDLDVGIPNDALLEQLAQAGGVRRVKPAKHSKLK